MIAWIGTDTTLRSAAAANHRREITLPPPASSRSAKAAVAACFVLACGVVLGITAAISDRLVVPLGPRDVRQPAVLGQHHGATSGPEAFSLPPKRGGPDPVASSAPVAIEPMVVDGHTPQRVMVPRTNGHVDHTAAAEDGQQGPIPVPGSAARSGSPRPTGKPGNPDQPSDSDKPVDADKPVDEIRPRDAHLPGDNNEQESSGTPAARKALNPVTPDYSSPPVETRAPGNADPGTSPAPPGETGKPIVLSKPADSHKPADVSNPGIPGNRGAGVSGRQGRPRFTDKPIGSRGRDDADIRSGSRNPSASKPASSSRSSSLHQGPTTARGPISAGKATAKGRSAGQR